MRQKATFFCIFASLWGGVLLLIVIAALHGCSSPRAVYVTPDLHRTERPVLPHVTAADLACMQQAAFERLYERQRLQREYAETLEAIIDSTKPSD